MLIIFLYCLTYVKNLNNNYFNNVDNKQILFLLIFLLMQPDLGQKIWLWPGRKPGTRVKIQYYLNQIYKVYISFTFIELIIITAEEFTLLLKNHFLLRNYKVDIELKLIDLIKIKVKKFTSFLNYSCLFSIILFYNYKLYF